MSNSPVVMWKSEWVQVGTKKVMLPDHKAIEVPHKIAVGDINPESRLGKSVLRGKKND